MQGSSSESEDNNATGKGHNPDTNGGGDDDDEHDNYNDDMVWMSDAESVGSDEVAKLQDEAGDLAAVDSDDDEQVTPSLCKATIPVQSVFISPIMWVVSRPKSAQNRSCL